MPEKFVCHIYHIYMQFSLLSSSDIKMVPQYCSYGSAGVPAVPATIFMSGGDIFRWRRAGQRTEPTSTLSWAVIWSVLVGIYLDT